MRDVTVAMSPTLVSFRGGVRPAAGRYVAETPGHLSSPARFLAHYIRRRGLSFSALLLLVVGAASCAIAVQYGMKLLVDAMADGDRGDDVVLGPLVFFVTLVAFENVLWRLAGWLNARTVVRTGADIRLDLFDYLAGHPMRYFSDHFAGALGGRITATAGAFGAVANTSVWNILPPCIDFLGALLLFLTVDWRMAAALAVFVMIVAGGLGILGVRGRPLHRAYAEQAGMVGGEVVDTVANIAAVKAFAARKREHARLERKLGDETGAQLRSWLYLEKTRVFHDVAFWAMTGSMLTWAVYLWTVGRVSPGEVVLVSTLTFRVLHGSRDLALALIGTTQHFATMGEMLRVVGKPHGVADRPQAKLFVPRGGAIEFEGVWYAYPDRRRVFRDFSLTIPAGQKVGIVGPSGAGKSTLAALVQRVDDVERGRVLVDGQDVAEVQQDSLRAAVAIVPQDISLFHRSLLENIRYGRPDATDEEVFAAARAAYCDGFIRSLPRGYDTIVGERGAKLSGGQRQRVGLARAILKDAPILILDEATSALDTESELLIQRAVAEMTRGRTVLAVAHRLSTLAGFDRIVVLVDGRVVEDGSPAQLRRSGGVFDALWRRQADSLSHDDAPDQGEREPERVTLLSA
jgi:ATP-binding cassette subfamily B protein